MQERWNVRAPTWWWFLFWVHRRSRLSLRMSGEVLVLVPIVSSGPLQLHGSEMWLQSRPGRRQTLHRKSKTTFLNPGQESEWWGNFPKFSAALIWKQNQTCCWRADPWTVLQLNDDFMRFHLVCFYFLFLFYISVWNKRPNVFNLKVLSKTQILWMKQLEKRDLKWLWALLLNTLLKSLKQV